MGLLDLEPSSSLYGTVRLSDVVAAGAVDWVASDDVAPGAVMIMWWEGWFMTQRRVQ